MDESILRDYARSILINGAHLSPGQKLILNAPTRVYQFTGLVAEEAYKLGASEVCVFWGDSGISRAKLQYAPDKSLDSGADADAAYKISLAEEGACSVSISSPDPDAMRGIDPSRIMKQNMADIKAMKVFSGMTSSNLIRWTIASAANEKWAQKCFPDMEVSAATERLWCEILDIARANNGNAVSAWQQHIDDIQSQMKRLNSLSIDTLHFVSRNGTNITVALNDGGRFIAGTCIQPDGTEFCPNIPTEEILMTPHRMKTNGTVRNSLPLVYAGSVIDEFCLTFRDGKVVDWSCGTGKDILASILDADEGSRYLGECSLVPSDSPINKTGHLFYLTLFDENAACHLALGRGYPDSVGGDSRSKEALIARGMNTSVLHVDFMFGTDDMQCTATTSDAKTVEVMRNGRFVL